MISHKYKFIYSHIPKAGGTTIESSLAPYVSKTFGRNAERGWLRNKKLFDAFQNHPSYYKFSFTRNPWDRLVSCYFFFKSTHSMINCSFPDFIKSIDLFLSDENSPEIYYSLVKNNTCADGLNCHVIKPPCDSALLGYHVLPQVYFIKGDFNFIGKMENLQQDFDAVCKKIGIPCHKLTHTNKSHHKPYWEYYDKEAQEIVGQKYHKDITMFNYTFR